jgi:hypothetical protein
MGPESVSKTTLLACTDPPSAFMATATNAAKAMCLNYLRGCCILLAICLACDSLFIDRLVDDHLFIVSFIPSVLLRIQVVIGRSLRNHFGFGLYDSESFTWVKAIASG